MELTEKVLPECGQMMVFPEPCPVKETLNILQGKWSVRVIYELMRGGTLRFGELKQNTGDITNTMLSNTLKDLENKGLVKRIQYNEIPPHVEYSLTESGNGLYEVFVEMGKWGRTYLKEFR